MVSSIYTIYLTFHTMTELSKFMLSTTFDASSPPGLPQFNQTESFQLMVGTNLNRHFWGLCDISWDRY